MLPDNRAELLELALRDLESCENNPNIKIDMETWFLLVQDVCFVCLAGAVMLKSLKNISCRNPEDYNEDTKEKLYFLDRARRRCTPYYLSPEAFKRDLRQLIEDYRNVHQH